MHFDGLTHGDRRGEAALTTNRLNGAEDTDTEGQDSEEDCYASTADPLD